MATVDSRLRVSIIFMVWGFLMRVLPCRTDAERQYIRPAGENKERIGLPPLFYRRAPVRASRRARVRRSSGR